MNREQPSNINVLVVGAGLGGLYAAIELHRQGHNVKVIEGKDQIEPLGDFVGIGPSVTKQFKKWPGMDATYKSIVYNPNLIMLTHDGEALGGPFLLSETSDYRPVPVARPKLIKALYEYTISLGVPVMFGKRVVEYQESGADTLAYAITDTGERFEADLVVAADGIGTMAGQITSGKATRAFSSGQSIYRVTYPTSILQKDTFLANSYPFPPGQTDYCEVYLSPKGTMIILVSRETTTWLLAHEDNGAAEETWSSRHDAADVLKTVEESGLKWDKRCIAVIQQTPSGAIIDFKITFRDPDPHWTSNGGRIIKIGDAAHAFIPNSTQGATQAMEDGQSLAACLKLATKNNVPLATRIHTKLRFERTSCAQKNGFKNRDKWDTDDFEKVKKNPQAAVQSVGAWLYQHDPEQYVYDNWQECLSHLVSGSPFKNTNIPPGYDYEPWTMEGLLAGGGAVPPDAGEWE